MDKAFSSAEIVEITNTTMINHRYELSKSPKKYRCPGCGQMTYTPYIDIYTNEGVGEGCGYCDRINHCKYHLPPREYFKTHPRPIASHPFTPKVLIPNKPKQLYTHPVELVEQYHNPSSTFCFWLAKVARERGIDIAFAKQAYEDYRLGCTSNRDVIFWQIDINGKVRGGKIMGYGEDGHRTGQTSWVHSKLKAMGQLTNNFEVTQCFFGEHLLAQRKDDTVCLVESEKSAVVLAMLFPEFVWVASSGCGGLSREKLEVLKDRHVIVYPDSGEYNNWKQKMKESNVQNYTMMDMLETYEPNTDLVDVLIENKKPLP